MINGREKPYTCSLFSKFRTNMSKFICFSCNIPLLFFFLLSPLFIISLYLSRPSLFLSISVLEEAGEGSESPRQRIRLRSPRTPIARRRSREKTDRQTDRD